MKKLSLGIILSIALFGGIIWLSYPDNNNEDRISRPSGTFALASEHNSFDFGNISMAKGNVTHTFKIKNTSDRDINITKLYTSCMCTTASLKTQYKTIGPYGMPGHGSYIPKISEVFPVDAEAEVEIVFDPAAHGPAGIGKIERVIFIENDGGNPLELTFFANVTP